MRAKVGDEIVVDATHTGEPVREGEVLEVMDVGGVMHFRVRWDDGRETVYFPGSDAHVKALGRRR